LLGVYPLKHTNNALHGLFILQKQDLWKMLSRLWTYINCDTKEYFLLTESMNILWCIVTTYRIIVLLSNGLIIFFNFNCWKEEGDVKEESLQLLLQKAPADKQQMASSVDTCCCAIKSIISTRMSALYTLHLTF
jgi:hypothetical protein